MFQLNRQEDQPLYLQIKRQIENLICNNVWGLGSKVPTERNLARILGVSRNTVSLAYRKLEEENILKQEQGRGTFVVRIPEKEKHEGEEQLRHIINQALEQASELGYSIKQFYSLVQEICAERDELLHKIKVAFVECNREQLDYFSRQLELGSGVGVVPVLLDTLYKDANKLNEILSNVDIIVTTFFHQEEVKQLFQKLNSHSHEIQIVGIALDPQLETMVRIARLSEGKKVGLVCISAAFADRVRRSLIKAGIRNFDIPYCNSFNLDELKSFVEKMQVIIVSPGRKREVEAITQKDKEIIEFIYEPDTGSINLLKSIIKRHLEKISLQNEKSR
ncbi:MAG: hypothetical protein PWP65_1933 [Clostridia bacterium]|nr:hypothetical protein [Clostridia bacterium]